VLDGVRLDRAVLVAAHRSADVSSAELDVPALDEDTQRRYPSTYCRPNSIRKHPQKTATPRPRPLPVARRCCAKRASSTRRSSGGRWGRMRSISWTTRWALRGRDISLNGSLYTGGGWLLS